MPVEGSRVTGPGRGSLSPLSDPSGGSRGSTLISGRLRVRDRRSTLRSRLGLPVPMLAPHVQAPGSLSGKKTVARPGPPNCRLRGGSFVERMNGSPGRLTGRE